MPIQGKNFFVQIYENDEREAEYLTNVFYLNSLLQSVRRELAKGNDPATTRSPRDVKEGEEETVSGRTSTNLAGKFKRLF